MVGRKLSRGLPLNVKGRFDAILISIFLRQLAKLTHCTKCNATLGGRRNRLKRRGLQLQSSSHLCELRDDSQKRTRPVVPTGRVKSELVVDLNTEIADRN